jgi:predicted nuclease of predicted toxin-antitoxin system
MPKVFHKHKLLLDEHMPDRSAFPKLNELFDVKHIAFDLNRAGAKDPAVYTVATGAKRILLTRNEADFRPLIQPGDPGIIGMPPHLRNDQIDSRLTAFLKRHSPNYFAGKYIALGREEI